VSELLQQIESYLKQSVYPHANQIDRCSKSLEAAFNGLGELGVLGLRVPQRWGGPQLDAETFNLFQELIARYSGALAFLQTQHQSVGAMFMQSYNTQLQAEYLPRMSQGNAKIGVGFSHLRRLGNPSIIAIPVRGGYQLNGFVHQRIKADSVNLRDERVPRLVLVAFADGFQHPPAGRG